MSIESIYQSTVNALAELSELQTFALIFAFSCFAKFLSEMSRHYMRYLADDSFLRFLSFGTQRQNSGALFLYHEQLYKLSVLGFGIASVCYGFKIYPILSLFYIILYCFYQNTIIFKFHTCYFILIGFSLLFYEASPFLEGDRGVFISSQMIIITTTSIYLFSAYRKWKQWEYRSGYCIGITAKHLQTEGKRRHFRFDNGLFFGNIRTLVNPKLKKSLNQILSLAAIAIEIAVPFLLFFDSTKPVGIFFGILMHIAFTLIEPRTLLHFGILTTGTYILF